MRPLVWADPRATIGERALLLNGAEHSCVLVRLPDGLGIATDLDFRMSLSNASLSREAPLSAICSVPVVTVTEHTGAPATLLKMVEQGLHHLVVTTDTGDPVGVVRVVDLASAEVRDPLLVRRLLQRAQGLDDLVQAASILPSTALELAAVGIPALRVAGILSAVRDLVAQRVVELTATSVPPTSVSWLVLGSSARREAMPGSDINTALAWHTLPDCRVAELRTDAGLVLTALERCGLSRCPDGANATEPLFSRSVEDWEEATRRWTHHPESQSALLLASIVADNRPLTSVDLGSALNRSMLASVRDCPFLDGLLNFTLAGKPPVGRIHDFAVEHTGPHRGQLDLKRGGLWPVVLLGRWMALVVGDVRGSTVDRVRRGSQAGILTTGEAEDLVGAFKHIFQLRFEREITALKLGGVGESHIDPGALDSLQRNYLCDSFRAITGVRAAVRKGWASGAVLGSRCRSGVALSWLASRLDDDLEGLGLGCATEGVVGIQNLGERELMRREGLGIELVLGDQFQEHRGGVRAYQPGRDGEVHDPEVLQGQLDSSPVHADVRDRPAGPDHLRAGLKGLRHPRRPRSQRRRRVRRSWPSPRRASPPNCCSPRRWRRRPWPSRVGCRRDPAR